MADWDNSRGDNGFGVATAGNGGLSGLSTPWSRALDRWSVEAKRAEDASYLRARVRFERTRLAELAQRLAATEAGKQLHKRRATAEMNFLLSS